MLLGSGALVTALDNGKGIRPAMGYNTWNSFATNIDEELIRETVTALVSTGLAAAGYTHFNLDDAWSEPEREDGKLVGNKERFPSGIKPLADFVHSQGLKFGIYSDAGSHTCAGFPGSLGHESVDAETWAEWGVDYLKYDNCFAPAPAGLVVDRYTAMGAALNKTGRPICYSLCEWGVAEPWRWAPQVGNSWRTTVDIEPTWSSIMVNLDSTVGLARFAGPGAWNDPDMLEVGNGDLTLGEQRAHFALWAVLKAPLLVGADLRTLAPESLAILANRDLIATNQDELGVAGDLVWKQGSLETYAAPLAGGGRALVLLNRGLATDQSPTSNITVHFHQLGYPKHLCAKVRDMYAAQDLGEHCCSFTAAVRGHDVVALKLTPTGGQLWRGGSRFSDWRPWHNNHIYDFWGENRPQPGGRRRGGKGGGEGPTRHSPRRKARKAIDAS